MIGSCTGPRQTVPIVPNHIWMEGSSQMIRKGFSTLLAVVLTIGILAGCSGKESTTSSGGSTPASTASGGSSAASGGKEVTVSIWSWRQQDKPLWEAVEKKLQEKGEKIKIEFREVKSTEYDATLKTAMNGGEGPDIITSRAAHAVVTYASANQYEPIDGKVAGLKDFAPGTLSQVSYNGKVYAVPFAVQTAQFVYNKEIFAKHGLKEPETWDDLIKLFDTLKAKGETPLFIPGREGWALNLYVDQIGATYLTDDFVEKLYKGEATFRDPKFVDVLKKVDQLKQYGQKDFMASNTTDERTAFANGLTAVLLDGIWSVRAYLEINKDLKIGTFMVPPAKKGDPQRIYAFLDGGYALNAASKNKEAALKILNFAASKEFGQIYTDTFGEISAYPGINAPEGKEQLKWAMERFKAQSVKNLFRIRSTFDIIPPGANGSNISTTMGSELQAMLDGKKTPEQVAEKIHADLSVWHPVFKKK